MPKVIENLQERILEVAEELFSKYGYNAVDMRAISGQVGIAVGTLYNYFPDKKTLFIEVFNESWKKIFLKLDEIIESDYDVHNKLILFIDKVYEGIVERKGIAIQLLIDSLHGVSAGTLEEGSVVEVKGLGDIGEALKKKARVLVEQIAYAQSAKLDEYILDKLTDALLLLVWGSVSKQSQYRERCVNFICDIIESYISKQAL